MTVLFWLSLALLVYIYLGYPLCVWLLARLRPRPPWPPAGGTQPSVSVLIAAFNEARHIESTVRNKLSQDYPPEKLEVIVVSDQSTDGTDEIVRSIDDARVRLVRQEPRAGKTSGLNRIAPLARGEILVFSDANSHYAPETVAELIKPFADPAVGYVTGRMLYRAPDGSAAGEGCSTYMRYENQLRAWETRLGSIVGVDGGVDAMRRQLWQPMRADQLPDFVAPLQVREHGYRVVYQPAARLYEDALAETADEFRMRVRVSLRAWWALKDKAALLNPLRFGVFAWQLWSHKVLRYLAPLFQLGALASNLALAPRGGVWLGLLGLQGVFYGVALAAHRLRRRRLPGPVNAVYYLCVLNLASAVALVQFLRGKKQVI
ncbi:MAG: glycosyltransferase family 2 protein, partial [Candidatus Krumholzibacteria bacterium]|nr:glycosyltransferase family 2 protein [Candidatus Krumholzibacteria bacterium]